MNSNNSAVDQTTIAAYLDNSMSPKEQFEFELRMEQDPFLADAVEGYQSGGAIADGEQMAKKFGPKKQFNWNYLWLGFILVPFIAIAVFFNEPVKNFRAYADDTPITQEEKDRLIFSDLEKEMAKDEEANAEIEIKEEVLIAKKTNNAIAVATPEKTVLLEDEVFVSLPERVTDKMEQIAPKHPKLKNIWLGKATEVPSNPPVAGQRIYHVQDYKLVDYALLRSSAQSFGQSAASLHPAYSFSASENGSWTLMEETPQQVSYEKYIELAVAQFAMQEYQLTIDICQNILEQFPKDVNAQFYGGMSAYYAGEYKIAAPLLLQAKDNSLDTFQEPAHFYWGASLLLSNQEEGRKILETVVRKGGFYAERAQNLLVK